MFQPITGRFARLAAVAVAALALSAVAARAADTPAGAGAGTSAPAELSPPPPAVLDGARTGSPQGLAALRNWFGPQVSPEEVARRAIGLIALLHPGGATGGTPDAAAMLQAMDRVTQAARLALDRTHVLKLSVHESFKPSHAVFALDFGRRGAPPASGFQRVAPGDPRITGNLAILGATGVKGMLADGVSGVRSIDLPVTGTTPFRIVLMTRNLGDSAHAAASFGHMIMANGAPMEVMGSHPDEWMENAMLLGSGGATGGQFEHGGAVVIEVLPVSGKIHLDLVPMGGMPTYLTGMLVEPANAPGDLHLSAAAQHAVMSIEQRLNLDAQIQTAAVQALQAAGAVAALQNIAPAAGNRQANQAVVPIDLPPPVFQNTEQASPS